MSGVEDALSGDGRDETTAERADRNWTDLLQELRVTQTGTQLLTAFLLSLPFQQRFSELDAGQVRTYLVVVLLSVLATALLVSPVALHRAMFRRRRKAETVVAAHRIAVLGLVVLGLAVAGAVLLVFDVVLGRTAGLVACAGVLLALAALWWLLPQLVRRAHGDGRTPS